MLVAALSKSGLLLTIIGLPNRRYALRIACDRRY
jgi:hypothetical protein